MTDPQRAASLGATGGLPGANAVPEASELTARELADTVATGDVTTDPVDPETGRDVEASAGPSDRGTDADDQRKG